MTLGQPLLTEGGGGGGVGGVWVIMALGWRQ